MGDHQPESSDEEGEILPDCVTNYHLVDDTNEPISFSLLPHSWSEDEIPDCSNMQIFLHGTAESGHTIYQHVVAWKLELSYVLPEIYVLSKRKNWIKLQSPRRSYGDTCKSIYITVHCLHFLKRKPEANGSSLWVHLRKTFSSYEDEPSESHLLFHVHFIKEAAMRDKDIAKSEYLLTLLGKKKKCEAFDEKNHTAKKPKFIVGTFDEDDDDEGDDDKDLIYDSVCVLCDNGGEILCCEDKCLRSFHPNVVAGSESCCEGLGYNDAQVEAIQKFLCNNCQYQQHQCFACGKLGSSDLSSAPEVFQCANANCGYFYHPECVAELLHPHDKTKSDELMSYIGSGESFACPAHKCTICKKGEDKAVYDLQFAVCRRCPTAYHRKCLPRTIAFDSNAENSFQQRAWDGLLSNRILIYCMTHKIIPEIGTPKRNHILFPNVDGKRQTNSGLLSSKEKLIRSKGLGNFIPKQIQPPKIDGSFSCGNSMSGRGFSIKFSFGKGASSNSLKHENASKVCVSSSMDNKKLFLGKDLPRPPLWTKDSQKHSADGKQNNQLAAKHVIKKASGAGPQVDTDIKSRILKLMGDATSSFNGEEFLKDQKTSAAHSVSSRILEDKTFTEGKVEGYVKAVREALKILERGGNLEDAKAVCEPQVLGQLVKWKRMLAVYLAPFIHGKRYTSFGRHFTKKDKLDKIVDMLKWYVQDGDMIVDFSCGSNDFSWFLKEKLELMGKRCSFRNYDLFAPKNDFCFERRDWMSVNIEELPAGSNLIMGLNPPFGVNASLANKFIDKALEFKPKLLILIVPKETRRLDRRQAPYDLIWEDDQILSGKSFYLPGSADANDNPLEQWNLSAPPLSLWSRPDWTAKHKAIADNCGHRRREPEMYRARRNGERVVSNYLMEENLDCYHDFSEVLNPLEDLSTILDNVPDDYDGSSFDATHELKAHTQSVYHYPPHTTRCLDNLCDARMEQNETSEIGEMFFGNNHDMMYVDMEMASPNDFTSNLSDQKNLSENNPLVDIRDSSDMYHTEHRFQYTQPTVYMPPKEDTAFVPNAAQDSGYLQQQMYEGYFGMPSHWSTGNYYSYNSNFYPRGPGF